MPEGPVLEVDSGTLGTVRPSSSVAAGFQRGAVSASISVVAVYYVNRLLFDVGWAPDVPEVQFHLDILITAFSVGLLTGLGKWMRNHGWESVV